MDEECGYSPAEIERGDDRGWHVPRWGCVVFAALLVLIVWGLYRFAIGLGVAWSIRV
jgi:hypothetical protein